jgi:transcriptional regulator with XRE-family HTH domain
MSKTFDRMRQSFPNKDYRHTYANGLVDSKLATQLKVLREQRGWTQAQLAEKCGMQQARISVLEDVNYASWSISTLRRIGKAFDLWLDVEWKEFGELPRTWQNMSRETLERESFDDDPVFHEVESSSASVHTIRTVTENVSAVGTISHIDVGQLVMRGRWVDFRLDEPLNGLSAVFHRNELPFQSATIKKSSSKGDIKHGRGKAA